MKFLEIFAVHGALETLRHVLNLRQAVRRARTCKRLLRVLPELGATSAELSRMLFDIQLTPKEAPAALVGLALGRANKIFERLFPDKETLASFWSQVEETGKGGAQCLKGRYADHKPPDRESVLEIVEMDRSPVGMAFRNAAHDPIFIPDIERFRELYGDHFHEYRKHVGSLVVQAVRVADRNLGVLKIESKYKGVFIRTPSVEILVRHVASDIGTAYAIGHAVRSLSARSADLPRDRKASDGDIRSIGRSD